MFANLENTQQAIRNRVTLGQDEGGFIDAVALCDWESALNRADAFHFANFTAIMMWRIQSLPRVQPAARDILGLFREVQEHPDFCGGTIWTKRDLAYAVYREDTYLDDITDEQIATVTEDERQAAISATENYVFRDYSWFEAMLDCDVFPDRNNTEEDK